MAAGCTAPWASHPSEVLSELPPLLESVAGQKYHCPQMESLRNGLPQTAFRTDGTARTLLAVIGSETLKFPDIKNPLSAPVIFSATGSHRASSAVACPQAGSPIQECISVTGYLLFKVQPGFLKNPSPLIQFQKAFAPNFFYSLIIFSNLDKILTFRL